MKNLIILKEEFKEKIKKDGVDVLFASIDNIVISNQVKLQKNIFGVHLDQIYLEVVQIVKFV